MLTKLSLKNFLGRLSSAEPVPGGGSTVALSASLAISLAIMVARIISKRPSLKNKKIELRKIIAGLKKINAGIFQAIDMDAAAYGKVAGIYKKAKPGRRDLDMALSAAFAVQKKLAIDIASAIKATSRLNRIAKGSIMNDLLLSRALLKASFFGACQTARINMIYIKDSSLKLKLKRELEKLKI